MKINEIIHINSRYRKQDCDNIDDSHVNIRIKTGKDIKHITVVYNDPYIRLSNGEGIYWPKNKMDMQKSGETENSYFFSCIVPCNSHRLKYYFLISDGHETLQYSETGFTKDYDDSFLAMFFVPYISKDNVLDVPKWVEGTVWYQIFPIRFNKNIKGITKKLLYLSKLGINGIYINPIFKAYSYHKYDVIDYTKIDEELGNEEDLMDLCNKAHKLNMKVMLDISFTHCSSENPMFIDAVNKGRKSKYFKFFKMDFNENNEIIYETFGMMKHMPKFETSELSVREYFYSEVVKKWMKFGVDAWRLDVANEISDVFLSGLKKVVRDYNKDNYIVGEIWHNASEWINNESLDGVTNYAFSRAVINFVANDNHDIFSYRSSIDQIIHLYTIKQLKCNMILLDSHDTPRLRTICNSNKAKVKLALLLLLTFYGTPSLYYGTERYMEGGSDPDNRRSTNWNDNGEDERDMEAVTKNFIKLRKQYDVLANNGGFNWVDHNELLIYRRSNDKECIYIVINSKDYSIDTVLPMGNTFLNVINGDTVYKNTNVDGLGFMALKIID